MRSKCKVCSQVFEVEPPVADGQELVCPYCGKLTVYRAPTRIEVPPRTPPSAEARPPAEGNTAASSEPGLQPVSRLRVIRPQNGPGRDSGKGNAMVDRVRARARDESRRQMLRKIGVVLKDIFWILVLLALVAGGWRLYRVWKSRTSRPTLEQEVVPDRTEREKRPIETNPESRRLYDESLERLMTGTVKYVSDMPEDLRLKNAKPGVGYDVLTSDKNGSVVLYALLRGEDGKLSVNRLSSDRAPRRVTGADLRAACAGKPYLVAVGGAVYLFGSSDLSDVARLRGKVR